MASNHLGWKQVGSLDRDTMLPRKTPADPTDKQVEQTNDLNLSGQFVIVISYAIVNIVTSYPTPSQSRTCWSGLQPSSLHPSSRPLY